jgi:nucleoside 2-deoxyribosyltransferase
MSGPDTCLYFENLHKHLSHQGWLVFQPMTGKGEIRFEKEYKAEGYTNPISSNHAIIERDMWMVRQSDVVLVDLYHSTYASIGCIMELAWAHLLGKHTVVVMEPGNNHRHAFMIEAADIIFEDLSQALTYLGKLSKGQI